MKEITMVTICEITTIEIVSDEDTALNENNELVKQHIKNRIKDEFDADKVDVLNNKVFIRDLPEARCLVASKTPGACAKCCAYCDKKKCKNRCQNKPGTCGQVKKVGEE